MSAVTDLDNVRVVSMPSWKLFDEQTLEYRRSVLTANGRNVPILSVEAAATTRWEKYSHFQHGMIEFGRSAPGTKVMEKFGFTTENIKSQCQKVINHCQGIAIHDVPSTSSLKLLSVFDEGHSLKEY